MSNVADNGNVQPFDSAFAFTNGEDIDKPLRRVLVLAVTGIQNIAVRVLGETMRRSRRAVSNNECVNSHRLNVAGRVAQRFSFGDG